MAVKTKLETKGFEAYLESLAQAGRDIDAIADEALQAGGEILAGEMHRLVAKDTGDLDSHIEVSASKRDGNFHFVEIGILKPDGPLARKANANEFGTSKMAAHPFIRPATDNKMSAARAAMRAVFKSKGIGNG